MNRRDAIKSIGATGKERPGPVELTTVFPKMIWDDLNYSGWFDDYVVFEYCNVPETQRPIINSDPTDTLVMYTLQDLIVNEHDRKLTGKYEYHKTVLNNQYTHSSDCAWGIM
jgi:hypothetical protein